MNKLSVLIILVLLFAGVCASFYKIPHIKAALIEKTKTFTSQTQDGGIDKIDFEYAVAHDAATGTVYSDGANQQVGQKKEGSLFYVYRLFLFFDTSIIPDSAAIVSAALSVNICHNDSETDFNVTVQNGQPYYPHKPLESGDYYYQHYSGNGGSRSTSELDGSYNYYWNITFNTQGESWVDPEGTTKLCLRSSHDINNNVPTGNEFLVLYLTEKGLDYAPKLYVTYEVEGCKYVFHGPCNEETGLKDGNITVWVYPASETPYSFLLDGTHEVSEEQQPLCFRFNMTQWNYTRFYVPNSDYEDIYVFKPNDPYYHYHIDLIDLLGAEDPYLESYLIVNGTGFTVERRQYITGNKIPYVLTWGKDYGFRIICSQGTYDFGHVTPTTEETLMFTLTSLSFPSGYTVYEDIGLTANRTSDTDIRLLYEDQAERTNYVNITVYRVAEQNTLIQEYATQQFSNTVDITWNEAETENDYVVKFIISHADYDVLAWMFPCVSLSGGSNPWNLDFLGKWPIDSSQIVGFSLVMIVFGCFSTKNVYLGLIIGIVVAGFFVWYGWLAINWSIITVMLCLAVLYALSSRKKQDVGS